MNEVVLLMLKVAVMVGLIFTLYGCAYSIKDVDVSGKEPSCIRECAMSYSTCVSQGNQVGFKTETLRACRESYVVCTNTCPAQQSLTKRVFRMPFAGTRLKPQLLAIASKSKNN